MKGISKEQWLKDLVALREKLRTFLGQPQGLRLHYGRLDSPPTEITVWYVLADKEKGDPAGSLRIYPKKAKDGSFIPSVTLTIEKMDRVPAAFLRRQASLLEELRLAIALVDRYWHQ